ncbi:MULTISPECIES: helix-turn-helix domain-containing protein [unclassified Ruegeria]|uniref:winged helix-turn-helix transcriptional regulator n=1 Tax=unclassified Ruegeria TaxID=2625375 RepID=UPI0020A0CD60|nr:MULTISPECIES: winged helix-turn-helix transcriptional regulator [unclassified Ruegeria]
MLDQGSCRFNQLQRNLGRITHRTLTRQLTELQETGCPSSNDLEQGRLIGFGGSGSL